MRGFPRGVLEYQSRTSIARTHLSHTIKPHSPITHPIHRQSTPPPSTPQTQNGPLQQSRPHRRRRLRSKAHQVCIPPRLPHTTYQVNLLTPTRREKKEQKKASAQYEQQQQGQQFPPQGQQFPPQGQQQQYQQGQGQYQQGHQQFAPHGEKGGPPSYGQEKMGGR